MTAAFWLALCLAYQPDDPWTFKDEVQRDGRSILTFRTLELTDTPGTPFHKDDQPPPGAKYGTIALGPGGKVRLTVDFRQDTNMVRIGSIKDGRYRLYDRFVLGDSTHEFKKNLRIGDKDKTVSRTILLRKRGNGLAYAVRGYTEGAVVLNGKRVAALLTDCDSDGCFDGAARTASGSTSTATANSTPSPSNSPSAPSSPTAARPTCFVPAQTASA